MNDTESDRMQDLKGIIQELEERAIKQEILIKFLRGELEDAQGWITYFEEKEIAARERQ